MLQGLSVFSFNLCLAMTEGGSANSNEIDLTRIFNEIQTEDAVEAAKLVADILRSKYFPPKPELIREVDRAFSGFLWERVEALQGGVESHPVNPSVSNELRIQLANTFERYALTTSFPILLGAMTAAYYHQSGGTMFYAGLGFVLGSSLTGAGLFLLRVWSHLYNNFTLQQHFYRDTEVLMESFWNQMNKRGFAVPTEPRERLRMLLVSLDYIIPHWSSRFPLVPTPPKTLREAMRCERFLRFLKRPI